jgi:YVTN family beta-propeller protein
MRIPRIIASTILLCISLLADASDLRQVGMINLPGPPGFGELAFADGMLLLAHTGASAVDVFDPARRRVVAQITGLQSPRAVAADDQAGKVYVADHGSNSIAVVSTDGWKVADSIALSGSPDALLLDGAGKLYWSDAANGSVSLLDLRTKQNMATVDVGGAVRDLAFDGTRHLVFATVQDLHQVVALDPQLKIVNRFEVNGSQPTGLVYDPQYQELYVSVRSAVLAINPDTGAEASRVTAPAGVDALWLDPDSGTLYAASEGSLLVIAAKGHLAALDNINTEVKGHTVAYDPAKRLVLVPGGREGKSKLQIFRPMTPAVQPGASPDTEASVK